MQVLVFELRTLSLKQINYIRLNVLYISFLNPNKTMNRRTLLQSAGLAGIAALIPFRNSRATQKALSSVFGILDGCVLVPTVEVGPFPWPSGDGKTLSTDQILFRRDITEGISGVPFTLILSLVNVNDNGNPITNANVVVWHCDKAGDYSEYANQQGGLDETGKSFLRGIQMTDANGQVTFKTIYPGWYPGRTTHIHLDIFLGTVWNVASQIAFPENISSAVYSTSLYSSRGQKDTPNSSDNAFGAKLSSLLLNVTGDSTNGYTGTLTVPISAPKSIVEPETGGQFKLGQNYPNPFEDMTTIPFTLTNPANVLIEIFDVNGKMLVEVVNERISSGKQTIAINKIINGVRLTAGAYVYQLTVENSGGTFRQSKMLTVN